MADQQQKVKINTYTTRFNDTLIEEKYNLDIIQKSGAYSKIISLIMTCFFGISFAIILSLNSKTTKEIVSLISCIIVCFITFSLSKSRISFINSFGGYSLSLIPIILFIENSSSFMKNGPKKDIFMLSIFMNLYFTLFTRIIHNFLVKILSYFFFQIYLWSRLKFKVYNNYHLGFYVIIILIDLLSQYNEEISRRKKFLKYYYFELSKNYFEQYMNIIEEDGILILSNDFQKFYFANTTLLDLFDIHNKKDKSKNKNLSKIKLFEKIYKKLKYIFFYRKEINEYYEEKMIQKDILTVIKEDIEKYKLKLIKEYELSGGSKFIKPRMSKKKKENSKDSEYEELLLSDILKKNNITEESFNLEYPNCLFNKSENEHESLIILVFNFIWEGNKSYLLKFVNQKRDFKSNTYSYNLMFNHLNDGLRSYINGTQGNIDFIVSELNDKKDFRKNSEVFSEKKNLMNSLSFTLAYKFFDHVDFIDMLKGEIYLNIEKINLKLLIEDIERNIRPQIESKKIKFVTKILSEASKIEYIYSDARRMKQVLCCLLINSLYYTKTGKIKLIVSKSLEDRRSITFSIKDSGILILKKNFGTVLVDIIKKTSFSGNERNSFNIALANCNSIIKLLDLNNSRGLSLSHSKKKENVFSFYTYIKHKTKNIFELNEMKIKMEVGMLKQKYSEDYMMNEIRENEEEDFEEEIALNKLQIKKNSENTLERNNNKKFSSVKMKFTNLVKNIKNFTPLREKNIDKIQSANLLSTEKKQFFPEEEEKKEKENAKLSFQQQNSRDDDSCNFDSVHEIDDKLDESFMVKISEQETISKLWNQKLSDRKAGKFKKKGIMKNGNSFNPLKISSREMHVLKEGDTVENRKILFINNESWDYRLFSLFKNIGFTLITAKNQIEALNIIESEKLSPNFFPMIFINGNSLDIDFTLIAVNIRNRIEKEMIPHTLIIGFINSEKKDEIDKCFHSGCHMIYHLPLNIKIMLSRFYELKLLKEKEWKKFLSKY